MAKILAKAGTSLADIYDVAGSVAGIEELDTISLPIVHEMGSTIFAERFHTTIRFTRAFEVIQSTSFAAIITNMPRVPTRILGIQVLSDNVGRVDRCAVMARNPFAATGVEIPLWVWDGTNGLSILIDIDTTVAGSNIMFPIPSLSQLPSFTGGLDISPDMVSDIALRGVTTAFGAGNVTITAFIYVAFAFTGGVSSFGLPIPSW